MNEFGLSFRGLLPLIPRLDASPAVYDDRSGSWLTRDELRNASLDLARAITSEHKRLVFLLCDVNSETIIGLLAAAAAGHATALIDPLVSKDVLTGLIEAYPPELILRPRGSFETLPHAATTQATMGSAQSRTAD